MIVGYLHALTRQDLPDREAALGCVEHDKLKNNIQLTLRASKKADA